MRRFLTELWWWIRGSKGFLFPNFLLGKLLKCRYDGFPSEKSPETITLSNFYRYFVYGIDLSNFFL